MTEREIKIELKKIYREMKSWPSINASLGYAIPEHEVRRRELILIGQKELYKLEDARKFKDKLAKDMHEAICNLIKNTLNLC